MQVREQVLNLVLKNVSQRSVTLVDQFGYLSDLPKPNQYESQMNVAIISKMII